MAEWQAVWDLDRNREIEEIRRKAEDEKKTSVEDTKKKQWCSQCMKEAIFYCCWNTSYCDYPCQQAHWPVHMATCAQGPNANKIKKEEEKMNKDPSSEVQVIGHRVREAVPATPIRVGIPVGGAANATPPSATLQFNNFSPSPNNRSGIPHAAAHGFVGPRSGGGASMTTSSFVLRPTSGTSSAFQPIVASPSSSTNQGFSPLFSSQRN